MEKSNQHIIQNASFCVPQKKESLALFWKQIFFFWNELLEIFWATTCAVDTARLHNCKQVTTASTCSSELPSHVAQSKPSYYRLQNTFHKQIKKTQVGPFAQAETAPGGSLDIHLGDRPGLEGWWAIPNTVPILLPHGLVQCSKL